MVQSNTSPPSLYALTGTSMMASSPQSNGVSQEITNAKHAQTRRVPKQFHGCSRIADYEVLGKLGEGTFG